MMRFRAIGIKVTLVVEVRGAELLISVVKCFVVVVARFYGNMNQKAHIKQKMGERAIIRPIHNGIVVVKWEEEN